ncbi:PH domain-containing protein [Flammeovirga pacifica]|uniref:Uncharacterized protein YyaB-like PH domain-containing protein n=1 Tax=Flammeovirga pacifica TaxID=915059 RepID=A0A1S1YVK5_FLAPC|nr:PH domain-containing protein [Flammeovirga pacifica]OHX65052.1 hypothetical protein NH26_01135 [Flammeovirga pacifica]
MRNNRFYSRVDTFAKIIWILILIMLFSVMSIIILQFGQGPYAVILSSLIIISLSLLLIVSFLVTSYMSIDKNAKLVKYKAGPFKGEINIDKIRKIKLNTRKYVGLKISLSFKKGMIIYYHKYDSIYFTPELSEEFCEQLKEINPNIEIVP